MSSLSREHRAALARAGVRRSKASDVLTTLSRPKPSQSLRTSKPRIPRAGLKHSQSHHRPHVLAVDRLDCWTTPLGKDNHTHLQHVFSREVASRNREVKLASWSGATRESYAAGLKRFTEFCDEFNISESDRMPASVSLLSTFLSSRAGSCSESTAHGWMAGLAAWHELNGAVWNGGAAEITRVQKGVKKLVPTSSKRPPRPPVLEEHLLILRHHLDLTNSFDAAVFAIACVAFWSICRLGEMLIPSRHTFKPDLHVSRAATVRRSATRDGNPFVVYHIPWTKTTQGAGAEISITQREVLTCPVRALEHHLACSAELPFSDTIPLFAYKTSEGWAPMTRDWFLGRVNQVWTDAGHSRLTGHSFRIGSATALLMRGVHPAMVQAQGRWKSAGSFKDYWRRVDEILPEFMSNSNDRDQLRARVDAVLGQAV